MKAKKLVRSNRNKMICGVCAGIGEYFNIDPTIVRLVFIIIGLFKGSGFFIYVVAAIIMPSDFSNYEDKDEDVSHLKSANADEEFADSDKKNVPHTDEEFDSFFKKRSK